MIDVRTQSLVHLVMCLDEDTENQRDSDAVLAKLGIKREHLAKHGWKPGQDAVALFARYACEQIRDNTFAARAGLRFRDSTTLTAYITKYSETLRDAVENSVKYYTLLDPDYSITMHESGNLATVGFDVKDPRHTRYHRSSEFMLFGALARMRTITQRMFHPLELRFDHTVRNVGPAISRLAGASVVFGAERCEILLSPSTMDLSIPTYDPSLREHLTEYGNRLKDEQDAGQAGLRERIEAVLAKHLPGRIVAAQEMAEELGMSRRTFARRLKGDDLSYREIVDDLRCDLASTYLKDGFSISEIAFYLDYGDQAAFSTAFKRWTGENPSDFRGRFLHS